MVPCHRHQPPAASVTTTTTTTTMTTTPNEPTCGGRSRSQHWRAICSNCVRAQWIRAYICCVFTPRFNSSSTSLCLTIRRISLSSRAFGAAGTGSPDHKHISTGSYAYASNAFSAFASHQRRAHKEMRSRSRVCDIWTSFLSRARAQRANVLREVRDANSSSSSDSA